MRAVATCIANMFLEQQQKPFTMKTEFLSFQYTKNNFHNCNANYGEARVIQPLNNIID